MTHNSCSIIYFQKNVMFMRLIQCYFMARQATDNRLVHAIFLPYVGLYVSNSVCLICIIIQCLYLCYAVTQKEASYN